MSLFAEDDDPFGRSCFSRQTPLRRLGDYELLEEIARGGMGVVYRARQISLNREVAVKLMRDSALAQSGDVKRFRAEAAAAAKLRHPHIIAIHSVEEDAGQHFFAMDLVEGMNLAERTRTGPLPPRDAAELVAAIAEAVQHAHTEGVLHRDLKPSNVLIDAHGRPFVTDFGLARPLDADSSLTVTGQVLGTPGYMPPEQATGKGLPGPAADIYSLGALLYHLLTGRAPFVGGTPTETLRQVLEQEPVSPQFLNPVIPGDLASVCLKSLAKQPGDRYASASALGQDLRRFLGGVPTLARPAGKAERLVRWCRRKPALAITAAIAILATVVGFAGITWQWRRAVRAGTERQEQLWRSQLLEARAHRISRSPGQRFEALETIARAAAYRPSLDLRNEAIAALLLPDLLPITNWHRAAIPHGPVAFTEDFTYCAAYNPGGRIVVQNTTNYGTFAELAGPNSETTWLQFSPDDQWLGVAFKNGDCQIWNWRERTLAYSYSGAINRFNQPPFDFGGDGSSLLCFGQDGLRTKNLRDNSPPVALLKSGSFSVRLSRSGRHVALFRDATLEIWDLQSRRKLAGHRFDANVAAVAWHPDEETVVVGTDADGFFAWDFTVGEPRHIGAIHAAVTHLFFNRTGDLLVASGWNDVTEIWDARDWTLLLRAEDGFAKQLSRDGRRIALAQEDKGYGIRGFSQPCGLENWLIPPSLGAPTESVRFSSDGKWLVTAHHGGWLIWNAANGRIVARQAGSQVQSCQPAPDFSACYTCDASGVNKWPISPSPETGEPTVGSPINLLTNAPPDIDRVMLTTDGRHLAGGGEFSGVLLDVDQDRPQWIEGWARRPAHWLDISDNGRWLAAGFQHGASTYVYDLESNPRFVTSLATGGGRFAFRPGSKQLFGGGVDGLSVWNTAGWKQVKLDSNEPGAKAGTVAGFSPDGGILFANRSDQKLTLRNAGSGVPIAVLDAPMETFAWHVEFDPSGKMMATTTMLPAISIWRLSELRRELRKLGLDWPNDQSKAAFAGSPKHRELGGTPRMDDAPELTAGLQTSTTDRQ